jgi:hypothetical protein
MFWRKILLRGVRSGLYEYGHFTLFMIRSSNEDVKMYTGGYSFKLHELNPLHAHI